ncbi:MAG: hemolysin family protein [Hyphomonadaceae bacterium]
MSDTPASQPKRSIWRRVLRALRQRGGGAEAAVAEALADSSETSAIPGAQKDMILNAARFDQLRVADVMTPRAAIVALEIDATLGEAARVFAESQHARLPLYRETLDDPLGFAHVKDLMVLLTPDESGVAPGKLGDHPLPKLKREILFVPASMRLPTVLLNMQARRVHLAIVVDEYGGTDGLISIEDVVEQIVGDIADEHDVESALVQARGGVFEADGRAGIDELEKALGASLVLSEDEGEFDTAGGLAVVLAGRVPRRGEVLKHPAGFDFEIVDADPRRVKRLRIKAAPPTPSPEAAA